MAAILGDRVGRMAISSPTMQGLLDSIATRLDEARDMSRYMTGLLVFLGLLGTFWGLIETVGSVGNVIEGLKVGGDAGAMFDALKDGLAAPLGGMGISFSSSLFGLAGSLVLGFLDLQTEPGAEPLLHRARRLAGDHRARPWRRAARASPRAGHDVGDFRAAIDRLRDAMAKAGPSKAATDAMANLAEAIQGLVHHMRNEQQMIRDWVDAQAEQHREIRRLLEMSARANGEPGTESMALARIRRERGIDYWPGFVDALSTLILGIIFLLTVFVVVQFFLSQDVAGKDTALSRLNAQIAQLTDLLSLEKTGKVDLEDQIARLRAEPRQPPKANATSSKRPPRRHAGRRRRRRRGAQGKVGAAHRRARQREEHHRTGAGAGRGAQPADRRPAPPVGRARTGARRLREARQRIARPASPISASA